MKSLTIREIAANLGVSPATVSIVLNDKVGVSDETRKRVKRYLIESKYTFPKERRRKTFGSVFLIKYTEHGMIVEENQGFIAAIIDQIQKDFTLQNINLTIVNCNHDTLTAELDRVAAQNPRGMILIASELNDSQLETIEAFPAPVVVVDHSMRFHNIDSVVMANEAIAYTAVKYLCQIGHRKIGHLRSAVPISNFTERRSGFEAAIESAGLTPEVTISLTPTLEGSYGDMMNYLNLHGDTLPAKAFFADNDAIAIGAIRALQEHGINVPEDVSVIGIDDIPFSAINTPPLTTMRISRSQLGHITVDVLTRRMKNPAVPASHYLHGATLIIRKSTEHQQTSEHNP